MKMATKTYNITFTGTEEQVNAALNGIAGYLSNTYPNNQGSGSVSSEGMTTEIDFTVHQQVAA
jgi:hypothetical protein